MKEARVTIEQMDIFRHTAGLDRGNTPYRNYFCAEEGHDSWDALLELVKMGLMVKRPSPTSPSSLFHLTYFNNRVNHQGYCGRCCPCPSADICLWGRLQR
ncbi:hypothetical protein [Thiolapillus sp.]|uniref:hypothetical protein n=3 Tax=Thiolapillus sp. TaxID=2017437 RepID=UPI003AF59078